MFFSSFPDFVDFYQQRLPIVMPVMALAFFTLLVPPETSRAKASDFAVDCKDISVTFNATDAYEVNCEKRSVDLAGMSGTALIHHLEAVAHDSSAFVDVLLYVLSGRVIYTGMDLRSNLKDFYGGFSVSDWQTGRPVTGLSTAEFKAAMRGLPSHCVAFQKFARHESGGYKKMMIGVACSQNNLDGAYSALKRLYLPN